MCIIITAIVVVVTFVISIMIIMITFVITLNTITLITSSSQSVADIELQTLWQAFDLQDLCRSRHWLDCCNARWFWYDSCIEFIWLPHFIAADLSSSRNARRELHQYLLPCCAVRKNTGRSIISDILIGSNARVIVSPDNVCQPGQTPGQCLSARTNTRTMSVSPDPSIYLHWAADRFHLQAVSVCLRFHRWQDPLTFHTVPLHCPARWRTGLTTDVISKHGRDFIGMLFAY